MDEKCDIGQKMCENGQNIIMKKLRVWTKKNSARFDNKAMCEFGQSCSAGGKGDIGQKMCQIKDYNCVSSSISRH